MVEENKNGKKLELNKPVEQINIKGSNRYVYYNFMNSTFKNSVRFFDFNQGAGFQWGC